jgi:hypothetical protein
VLPVLIFALVAIPLLIIAVAAVKKRSAAEQPVGDAASQAEIEREFDEAERYQDAWRDQHPRNGSAL